MPVTIVRPAGAPPWPALVFVNGATPDGRTHPMVLRLSPALARSGHLVFIPDLPGHRRRRAVARDAREPRSRSRRPQLPTPEAAHGRVALAGVSIGASLALLVAADPALAERISAVACVAPYSDLAKVMLLATTGTYREGGESVRPTRCRRTSRSGWPARWPRSCRRPGRDGRVAATSCARVDPASAAAVDRSERPRSDELGDEAMTLFRAADESRPDALRRSLRRPAAHVRATVEDACRRCTQHRGCVRRSRS